jgi:predicted ATPase
MIKKWSLKNFKSIQTLDNLEFAPLTIFAGANSSGKSTILQSILLTAQTLQNSINDKSIILNGHIAKFGTFNDLLTNNAKDQNIQIGFRLLPLPNTGNSQLSLNNRALFYRSNDIEEVVCKFTFSDQIFGKTNEILQFHPKLVDSYLEVKSKSKNESGSIQISRSKKSINDRIKELDINEDYLNKVVLQSFEFEVKSNSFLSDRFNFQRSNDPKMFKNVGSIMKHFLPYYLTKIFDKNAVERSQFWNIILLNDKDVEGQEIFDKYMNPAVKSEFVKIFNEVLQEMEQFPQKPPQYNYEISKFNRAIANFTFLNYSKISERGLLSKFLIPKIEENKTRLDGLLEVYEQDNRLNSVPLFISNDYITDFFTNKLKYLGPLRDEPKSVYPLSASSDHTDVGFKGENTAAVIDINRNTIISYIEPGNIISHGKDKPKVTEDTLLNAVLDWLDYMGIANKIDSSDKGKLGHELKISTRNSKALHDLTHVGVGVSQVLPILVLSLLAGSDSTLIFEQPELHLNPKVQTRLADFFFSVTLLQKQCIVETHSEYLINRLRYLVATNDDDKISENSLIYFVEKESDFSSYKKVKINKYGVIDDWPRGFFDENEETAALILRAAMSKRKKEKEED